MVKAFDLLMEIDAAMQAWHPAAAQWALSGDSNDSPAGVVEPGANSDRRTDVLTPARLRHLAAQRWRPQDARDVEQIAADIEAWSVKINALLSPQRVKTICAACPACGARTVYRWNSAGERVAMPALQVIAEQGCTCVVCRTCWTPDRYLLLCRVLGFDLPAGCLE